MMDSYLPKSRLYDILASRYGTDFLCPSKSVPTLVKLSAEQVTTDPVMHQSTSNTGKIEENRVALN